MVAITNLSLTFPYINKGKYKQAEKLINEVYAIAKKTKNESLTINAHLRLGYKESAAGRMDKAITAYLKGYNYYKTRRKTHEMGDIINRLGGTYMEIGDCATAMRYWQNYIAEVDKHKAEGLFVIPMKANMIDCFLKEKNFVQAKQLSYDVINSRKKSNSTKLLSSAYSKLANVYLLENQYEKALSYNDTAYHYAQLFANEKVKASVLLDRAQIFEKLKNKQAALNSLKSALAYASSANTPLAQMEAYKKLSTIHYQLNKLELAYYYDQKSDSISEKIYSSEVISTIKNLEKEIIEKNSNEKINLLQIQNQLQNKAITQGKNLNKISKILLVLSLLILALISYLFYSRTQNNKLLKFKNVEIEKSLAANKMLVKEIHHRVKNNLQVVSSLLGIQSRFASNKAVQEAILASKTRVQAMSLLHQNLYKNDNLKTISIKKYFSDLIENLKVTYSTIEQNIALNYSVEDLNLDFDQVITLGLIINELLTNAIKHAFPQQKNGVINFTIKEIGPHLYCTVSDNGIGMPFAKIPEKSASMGMQLIKIFINKLEASIDILNESGTQINLSFLIEK